MRCKLKKKVIFTVLLFFELFVSFLRFFILLYKLLKLQNYCSSLNFVGNQSSFLLSISCKLPNQFSASIFPKFSKQFHSFHTDELG